MIRVQYKPGDKIKVKSLPKNSITDYIVGEIYTLKCKSYDGKRFQGWLTEENSFWVIKQNCIEKI